MQDCEHDCKYYCVSCDKSFCDIKTEEKLDHGKELPETLHTNEGYFCHTDCHDSYWGN